MDLPAFAISRYPITNEQDLAFVKDGGYTTTASRVLRGRAFNFSQMRVRCAPVTTTFLSAGTASSVQRVEAHLGHGLGHCSNKAVHVSRADVAHVGEPEGRPFSSLAGVDRETLVVEQVV